jgi:hypothetical protein
MATTNKWLLISESHGDSNRCTSYRGKPNQQDMYASHASPRMPDVHFLWVVHVHGNHSRSRQQCRTDLLLPAQPPARLSNSWVTVYFSPKPASEAVHESHHLLTTGYLVYWAHKHQHVIGTFNTCSRVPTTRSLTNTRWGYHIETSE